MVSCFCSDVPPCLESQRCHLIPLYYLFGSRDSLLVRAPDSWSNGCEFDSRQKRREFFFSRVNFECWLLFGVRSIHVLPQWHVKDHGHTAKSAGGRLHLNTHSPWPTEVGVDRLCHCPGTVWEPIRKRAHTQLVRKYPVTVVSARWDTVDWSWPKEWN